MKEESLRDFLEEKYYRYNNPVFVETDPIQVPKRFSKKEDIEIAGFMSATIAWGQRPVIVKNAISLVGLMDNRPYEFLMCSQSRDFAKFGSFVHRTFNGIDCRYFLEALSHIYKEHGGMEAVFSMGYDRMNSVAGAISHFRHVFMGYGPERRTEKQFANPGKGSAAKRINMFLRWMVRSDQYGVDFGIWKRIPPSALMMPLDVHSGSVARKLGLLARKQNDWKAVEELTSRLAFFDKEDPVKYDFALFGLGVFERF